MYIINATQTWIARQFFREKKQYTRLNYGFHWDKHHGRKQLGEGKGQFQFTPLTPLLGDVGPWGSRNLEVRSEAKAMKNHGLLVCPLDPQPVVSYILGPPTHSHQSSIKTVPHRLAYKPYFLIKHRFFSNNIFWWQFPLSAPPHPFCLSLENNQPSKEWY